MGVFLFSFFGSVVNPVRILQKPLKALWCPAAGYSTHVCRTSPALCLQADSFDSGKRGWFKLTGAEQPCCKLGEMAQIDGLSLRRGECLRARVFVLAADAVRE